jgi:hypothetical protein
VRSGLVDGAAAHHFFGMTEDREARRAYWSAILAAHEKQLASLLERHLSLVDDSGRDLTPSVIATHEQAIAEAKGQLAALDQARPIWSDRRGT